MRIDRTLAVRATLLPGPHTHRPPLDLALAAEIPLVQSGRADMHPFCERRHSAVASCCGMALLVLLIGVVPARGQTASAEQAPAGVEPSGAARIDTVDIIDVIRKLRHKELATQQEATPPRRMYAAAPVIGYKPSSGPLFGVAGNVAFFRGDPATTHISSAVASLTYSTKNQTALTARFGIFGASDRWKLDGDDRFLWTSQDTYGLGTGTVPSDKMNLAFDHFRIYETVYRGLGRGVFAGLGFHYNAHTNTGPGTDADQAWPDSPYVTYSEAHGLSPDSQTSAGASVNFLVDTRDNAINPERGWLGSATYRPFFKGFLGGDSNWQELYLDLRTYRVLDTARRHKLAFWVWGDMILDGAAPYLDLPATGMDTYGRSGRGYAEGRYRGERLLYGEIEYRATLTSNGLIGAVAFVNTSTFTNRAAGERLFDRFATGGGAGLRLLVNKRSKSNLCLDFGLGAHGSRGVYLAIQEAF